MTILQKLQIITRNHIGDVTQVFYSHHLWREYTGWRHGDLQSKASDNKQEIRETSPDGAELNSCNAQLLEEELDNIDCPMAGSMSKSSTVPSRPKDLQLGEKLKPLEVCSWQVLDITFGIPLFDMDLNAAVTKR